MLVSASSSHHLRTVTALHPYRSRRTGDRPRLADSTFVHTKGLPQNWLYLMPIDFSLHIVRYFPDVDLSPLVEQVLQTASEQGTGAAMQGLRQQLRHSSSRTQP